MKAKPFLCLLIFATLLPVVASASVWQVAETQDENTDWTEGQVVVDVLQPGGLRLAVVELEEEDITRLKIRGSLNSVDIGYLVEGKGKIANLESLDMSEVTLVYGGDAYNSYTTTSTDVSPFTTDFYYFYLSETEYIVNSGNYPSMAPKYYHYYYSPNLCGAFIGKAYKHIVMPASVKKAATMVCKGCKALESIEFTGRLNYIESTAFIGCEQLQSFDLQNTDTIGSDAFMGCKRLTTIESIDKVKVIGARAFSGCPLLRGNRDGMLTLTHADSISYFAFYGCSSIENVSFSDQLRVIDSRAFMDCKELTSAILPQSVYTLGDECFANCANMTTVTLPKGLNTLGKKAFSGCTKLTEIKNVSSVEHLTYTCFLNTPWLDNLPDENGVRYIETTALCCSGSVPNTLTFRNGTFRVADEFISSLNDKSQLTGITFPSTLAKIGNKAFYGCSSLKSITLPEELMAIGDYAFQYCGLIQANYKAIAVEGKYIFDGCPLEKVTIGAKVRKIPESMFSGCKSLVLVKFESRGTDVALEIGNKAFENCEVLASVNLPESTFSIGEEAFSGCNSLPSFIIPKSITSINDRTFYNCRNLTSVTIPQSVTSIGESAFEGCDGLTDVTMPNSLTNIGKRAFSGCSGLTDVTIPNRVTSIGEDAFYGCI